MRLGLRNKLEKATSIPPNNKRWVHPAFAEEYMYLDEGSKGFVLYTPTRMVRFSSRSEASSAGWAELLKTKIQYKEI